MTRSTDQDEVNLVRESPRGVESVYAPGPLQGTDVVAPETERADLKLVGCSCGHECECGNGHCCDCASEPTG